MELTDALPRQAAVVKLQDVPHLHSQGADLITSPIVRLHQTVAPAHVEPVQYGADGTLMNRQHEGGTVRTGMAEGGRILCRVRE